MKRDHGGGRYRGRAMEGYLPGLGGEALTAPRPGVLTKRGGVHAHHRRVGDRVEARAVSGEAVRRGTVEFDASMASPPASAPPNGRRRRGGPWGAPRPLPTTERPAEGEADAVFAATLPDRYGGRWTMETRFRTPGRGRGSGPAGPAPPVT